MHATHYLSSIYYILAFCFASHSAATEVIPNAYLLPDQVLALHDYEVLSIRDEGDEDVFHLRRRTEQDCETDCLNYSGWEEDSQMHHGEDDTEDGEMEDEEVPDKRELDVNMSGNSIVFEKRGSKVTERVCDNVMVDQIVRQGFTLRSPNWANPKAQVKKYSHVYDIGDPRQPLKKEWFELQKRGSMWKNDLAGKTNPVRDYSLEHILEWQILRDFIEEDKDTNPLASRCVHLHKWFLGPMPKGNHKVKVAKNNGKLDPNDRFDYEDQDYTVDTWANTHQPIPRLIEWISAQWPGKAGGRLKSPWQYEMVVLYQDANLKKENVWANKKLFVEPDLKPGTKKMKEVQTNSETLEWLFENKYYEGGKVKTWPDNKGTCKAIYRFMTIMTIAQYHNQPYVKEVLRAQIRRVGEAWELIEKEILAHRTDPITGAVYKERGLKKEWLDFTKALHKKSLKALNDALDAKIDVFNRKSDLITKLKRWDYGAVFQRRDAKVPNCGTEKNSNDLEKRIDLLKDAFKSLAKVEEELKLD